MGIEQAIATIRFEPLLPDWLLGLLAGVALIVLLFAFWRRARGSWFRALCFAVLLLWLVVRAIKPAELGEALSDVSPPLMLAGAGVIALALLNVLGVSHRGAYLLVGVFVWVCVLKSGVHATLAGVVTGLAIPLRSAGGSAPAHDLERDLHPWVAFGVLPAFAFTNAGVGLADVAPAA